MRESQIKNLMNYRERRVGLEFENHILDDQAKPITAQRMQQVWKGFERAGWEIGKDPALGVVTGADKRFQGFDIHLCSDCIAGNLEMAFSPADTLAEAEEVFHVVQQEVLQILNKQDVTLISTGMQPDTFDDLKSYRAQDTLYTAAEKCRVSTFFNNGINTAISADQAGVSIHLDEVLTATNELIKITALMVALCANSSIHNWKILSWLEWRILAWDFRSLADNPNCEKLCGFPERPFTTIADYLKYYWSVSNMLIPPIREQGWIVPDKALNFEQYFKVKSIAAHDLAGNEITLEPVAKDLNLAMILMWPYAKPHLIADPEKMNITDFMKHYHTDTLEGYLSDKLVNCYIENRIPATAPIGEEMAVPALTLGLVNNLADLQELTQTFTWNQWRELVYIAAVQGMETEFESVQIIDLVQEMVSVAAQGLKVRKLGEEKYLNVLQERIDNRESPAQKANKIFQKKGKAGLLDYIRY